MTEDKQEERDSKKIEALDFDKRNYFIAYYGGQTSLEYSNVRYTPPINSYIKYLFTTRLEIFLKLLKQVIGDRAGLSIFEVGCADGILFKNIVKKFPGIFNQLVGIDITPDMIEVAKKAGIDNALFFVRDSEPLGEKYDVVIEIGVHSADLEDEIIFIKQKLKDNGHFIKTISSRASSHTRLKLRDKIYVQDFLTYDKYEEIFRKYFEIVEIRPYSLFVPKLWSLPWKLSLPLQRFIDFILRPICPNLFHEKIYLLKNRP